MTIHATGARNAMLTAAVALAFTFPAQQAVADAKDAIIGLGAGLAIGCIASGKCGNNNRGTKSVKRAPQPWSAERQQRAAVQSALNDFGYPVGSADGVYGRNTRTGMSNFQASMGFPPTGNLTPYEQQILLGAHHSYTSGMHNSTYPGLFQSEGMHGLLRATADPNYYGSRYGGGVTGGVSGTGGYGGIQQPVHNNFGHNNVGGVGAQVPNAGGHGVSATQGGNVQRVVTPQEPQIAIGGGGLVPLDPVVPVTVSMQDHCDIVKLATQTNGGHIQASNMVNPDQALSEQFCDARTHLMGRVQTILGVARATEDELLGSCSQVEAAMKPAMASIGAKGAGAVTAEAAGISGSLGLSDPAAAAEYGEVCLGLGYRSNNSEMALAGAMMLVGAGRAPFAEMVGHHVRKGFGTPENPAAAREWYEGALSALANNQPPAVLPSQTIQRTAIIRAAVDAGDRRVGGASQTSAVPVSNTGLAPLNLGGN